MLLGPSAKPNTVVMAKSHFLDKEVLTCEFESVHHSYPTTGSPN